MNFRHGIHSTLLLAFSVSLLGGGLVRHSTAAENHRNQLIFKLDDALRSEALLAGADPLWKLFPEGTELGAALPGGASHSPECASVQRALLRAELPEEYGGELEKLLGTLKADPAVVWAERPPERRCDLVPDDPYYSELWALPRVEAPAAWDQHIGGGEVVIAVVDTGVELDHEDLEEALWVNEDELQGSPGVDDDGNGWVDDVHGYDTRDGDGDPNPEPGDQSHGTHVAGTAACATDNTTGVSSIVWDARLMALRAGHGSLISDGVEGIYYAAVNGAEVINCSWGGDSYSHYEQEVIALAGELGALVVASAGNAGNDREHYPGAYEGVLCVAATNPDDVKLGSSQYGSWVDLAAPGSLIYSTMIGGSYGTKSGTSMATPHVTSLCGLVRSRHPAYGPAQAREHVVFTCDNIDDVNPGYEEQLGRGRINALQAMTASPEALVLDDWTFEDADQNGVADPGEEVEIVITLAAMLGDFESVQVQLSMPEGGGEVLDGQATFPPVEEGGTTDNAAEPFLIEVDAQAEHGQPILLRFAVSATGGYSHLQYATLVVAPTYASHDNGQITLSLSGHGAIGYYDFEENQSVGLGLLYPQGGPGHLYHGSLLIALNDCRVADMASYLIGSAGDFQPLEGGDIQLSDSGEEQRIEAAFCTCGMEPDPGIEVNLVSRSRIDEELEGVVLVEYHIWNAGESVLENLRPGVWMDFDVDGSWGDDGGGWEEDLSLCWQTDDSGRYLGVSLLSEPAASFRLCRWDDWSQGGLTDDELCFYMGEGFQQIESDGPDDWQCLMAGASEDLDPGSERLLSFGILAAESLSGLREAAEAAIQWREELPVERPLPVPGDFHATVAPNPFNPGTRLRMHLSAPGEVQWEVYDLLGRRIMDAPARPYAAGTHLKWLDFSDRAAGLYFLRIRSGARTRVDKLLLVK